jgi:hypothetical protein
MTAFALQILVDKDMAKAVKAANFLVSKKELFQNYGSTQNTIQALFSLSLYGKKVNAEVKTVSIRLTPNIGTSIKAQVSKSNALLVQEYTLSPFVRRLKIVAGDVTVGNTIVSLTCNFYELSPELTPRFNITTKFVRPCYPLLTQEVCVSYIPEGDDTESNMALVRVTLPTCYVYDPDQKPSPIIRV